MRLVDKYLWFKVACLSEVMMTSSKLQYQQLFFIHVYDLLILLTNQTASYHIYSFHVLFLPIDLPNDLSIFFLSLMLSNNQSVN